MYGFFSSDNWWANAPIFHFSKVQKNLSRAASLQGPQWSTIKKDWLPTFAFDSEAFQQQENSKRRRRDELLGLQKSRQKPFLSALCPADIHLARLKSEDGTNFGLKRNFSTSKRNLATGSSIWNMKKRKKEKRKRHCRNGRDFQTKRKVRESDNGKKMKRALSS